MDSQNANAEKKVDVLDQRSMSESSNQKRKRLTVSDLVEAIEDFDEMMILECFDEGVDVNARNNEGQTMLQRACILNQEYGTESMCALLGVLGADPNLGDMQFLNPLESVLRSEKEILAIIFVYMGADVSSVCIDGKDILAYSREKEFSSLVELVEATKEGKAISPHDHITKIRMWCIETSRNAGRESLLKIPERNLSSSIPDISSFELAEATHEALLSSIKCAYAVMLEFVALECGVDSHGLCHGYRSIHDWPPMIDVPESHFVPPPVMRKWECGLVTLIWIHHQDKAELNSFVISRTDGVKFSQEEWKDVQALIVDVESAVLLSYNMILEQTHGFWLYGPLNLSKLTSHVSDRKFFLETLLASSLLPYLEDGKIVVNSKNVDEGRGTWSPAFLEQFFGPCTNHVKVCMSSVDLKERILFQMKDMPELLQRPPPFQGLQNLS